MNRGVFQSSPVQQQIMMGGSPGWWTNLNSMRPPLSPQLTSSLLPPPSPSPSSSSSPPLSSLSSFPQMANPSTSLPLGSSPWHDNQELPESWSQLLLGGLMGEEERCGFTSFLQQKKAENWEGPVAFYHPSNGHMVDVKQERSDTGYAFGGGGGGGTTTVEEIQATRSPWSQLLPVSSPNSCVTSFSGNTNMLDFASSNKNDGRHPKPDHSSECNSTSTGSAFKKARVQGSSSTSSAQSTFKVRKEKLGDRITALHQLVSPFGKTDTASVLLEAIGYIRFLQNQIEALSSPYLGNARHGSGQGERGCIFPEEPGQLLNDACLKRRGPSADQKEPGEEPKKDLRSRGLCLVPISCTMHVGSDNGADFWAPTLGGGFR